MYLTTYLNVFSKDKPTSKELKTCFNFFNQEINHLKNHNNCCIRKNWSHLYKLYKQYYEIKIKTLFFMVQQTSYLIKNFDR